MKYILIFSLLLFSSCSQNKKNPFDHSNKINSYKSVNATLYLPFDTLKVIALLDIKCSDSDTTKLFSFNSELLSDKIDTLILEHVAFACDCPNWVLEGEYEKNFQKNDNPQRMHEVSYYIEPGNLNVQINPILFSHGNKIKLIGRTHINEGFPNDAHFIDPSPPKGKVFRYYSYEIIKPAKVFGPDYYTGTTEIPNDTIELIMATEITLK